MTDSPRGAVLQRDGETYAVIPNLNSGLLNLDMLKRITGVVEKYQIPIVKLTGAQRIALVGLQKEEVENVWNDLGMEPAPAVGSVVRSVQTCPGIAVCKNGKQNSLQVSAALQEKFLGKELPNKLKMGVSGCPICCAESWLRDIGLIGKPKGWTVVVGGNAGGQPRIADKLEENLDDEQVLQLVEKIINVYEENAEKKERIGKMIDRMGLEEFKQLVL
ncbi:MAG: NAD(P)/FAD-dependent oxidoreductase [Clostridiales bacterium]|nr:NAD(P)/FAD-dependent oxidoreductase [Clostridiales bacterium]MCF8023621.1 NAD(P)/FAD-dependent oxidoreductase [Clostridiales bacterium]